MDFESVSFGYPTRSGEDRGDRDGLVRVPCTRAGEMGGCPRLYGRALLHNGGVRAKAFYEWSVAISVVEAAAAATEHVAVVFSWITSLAIVNIEVDFSASFLFSLEITELGQGGP